MSKSIDELRREYEENEIKLRQAQNKLARLVHCRVNPTTPL